MQLSCPLPYSDLCPSPIKELSKVEPTAKHGTGSLKNTGGLSTKQNTNGLKGFLKKKAVDCHQKWKFQPALGRQQNHANPCMGRNHARLVWAWWYGGMQMIAWAGPELAAKLKRRTNEVWTSKACQSTCHGQNQACVESGALPSSREICRRVVFYFTEYPLYGSET